MDQFSFQAKEGYELLFIRIWPSFPASALTAYLECWPSESRHKYAYITWRTLTGHTALQPRSQSNNFTTRANRVSAPSIKAQKLHNHINTTQYLTILSEVLGDDTKYKNCIQKKIKNGLIMGAFLTIHVKMFCLPICQLKIGCERAADIAICYGEDGSGIPLRGEIFSPRLDRPCATPTV